ncbi:MAG TPA: hypothetical protein GX701_05975 [Clostridiales bacterium]|jgi:hypothetical protein|nr:hypothetical protein [Clostridiales bacterium]
MNRTGQLAQCTVFGRERKPLLDFLSSYDNRLFQLKNGGNRFRADGIFLSGIEGGHPYLFAPGENVRYFRRFEGACIVSCGLSQKNTVSISSVTDERLIFSLLRELPVMGETREVQEIPSRRSAMLSPELACLAAGLLLVCGIPPEDFMNIDF